MKVFSSAFYNDSIKLSLWDFFRLLIGKTVTKKWSAIKIGLWRVPDNNCPCEHCKTRFGKRRRSIKSRWKRQLSIVRLK